MGKKFRKVVVTICAVTGALVLLLLLLAVVGRYWIVPVVARNVVSDVVGKRVVGRVDVGDIDVRFDGTASLESLAVYDEADRQWLDVRDVALRVHELQGLKPVVSAWIQQVTLSLHVRDGKCFPPIRSDVQSPHRQKGTAAPALDILRRAGVRSLTVEAVSTRRDEPPRKVTLLDQHEILVLPDDAHAGSLMVHMEPGERGNDAAGAATLVVDALVGQRMIDVSNCQLQIASGQVYISGTVAQHEDKSLPPVTVMFDADDLDLSELTSLAALLVPTGTVDHGLVHASGRFSIGEQVAEAVKGDFMVTVDDGTLARMPVVLQLHSFLKLKSPPLTASDVFVSGSVDSRVITIEQGKLANIMCAFELESGATIDLSTRTVDMYVIAMPFDRIQDLLKTIPIVNVFMNLKDKLTRLRVVGNWEDPPAKLVKATPVTNIKQGTSQFMREVFDGKGQFSRKLFDVFTPASESQPSQ